IQYVRTPCFGTCPHFELDVYSTGRAQYNGKRFVQNEGVFTGTWSSEDIMAVFEAAEEINYFELQSTYDNRMVMDLPSVTTRILSGDTLKSVMNRYQGPPELNELYKVLDQIISQTNWTAAGQ
ncbi:MAG: hypothetical protein KDC12_15640, partial [Flavobacteriales bacterium]|nr:hypothetical protein [Flavobacteriales bacterium]